MISLANQELLAQAIESVKARRESQAQAAQAQHATVSAQRFDMAKTKMGLAAKSAQAKPAAKAKGAKPKVKGAVVGNTQPGSQDITPYLESDDLMAMADRGQADDTAVADTNFAYEVAAANAIRGAGDVERGRVASVAGVNDDAAGRGMYYSGVRQGGVGMANADAARRTGDLQSALAVDKTKQQSSLAGIAQGRAQFAQAMIARAAENGMALPVNPYDGAAPAGAATPAAPGESGARQRAAEAQRKSPSQNGAANVKGAVTLSKKQPVSAKLGAAPRPTSRIKPRPGTHRSKLKAVY